MALDLSLVNSPDQSQSFCDDLLDTLKKRGVARLTNHGVSEDTINELFEMTRKFFAAPHEDKMIAKHPPESTPNRGYSYVGQESVGNISGFEKGLTQGKFVRDIKVSMLLAREGRKGAKTRQETFDMGSPTDSLVDNIWMPEDKLPGFRCFMEDFYARCFELEQTILIALARALKVPEQKLLSLHSAAENEFRLLHYPAIPASVLKDGTSTRIAEHTDFGTITMLFQDSTGGLQVEDQENLGTFHGIESSKTEIILNIGDSLQRLTNDTFRAACHRVTYPPTVKINDGVDEDEVIPERYSIAYFAKPNRNASLLPFSEFVNEARPCRYDDMTAWDYNNLRIGKLYQAAA